MAEDASKRGHGVEVDECYLILSNKLPRNGDAAFSTDCPVECEEGKAEVFIRWAFESDVSVRECFAGARFTT